MGPIPSPLYHYVVGGGGSYSWPIKKGGGGLARRLIICAASPFQFCKSNFASRSKSGAKSSRAFSSSSFFFSRFILWVIGRIFTPFPLLLLLLPPSLSSDFAIAPRPKIKEISSHSQPASPPIFDLPFSPSRDDWNLSLSLDLGLDKYKCGDDRGRTSNQPPL